MKLKDVPSEIKEPVSPSKGVLKKKTIKEPLRKNVTARFTTV